MRHFPQEFADLLNAKGRELLAQQKPLAVMSQNGATPIALLDGLIDDDVARACMQLLDRAVYPLLKRMRVPIPREALTEMTEAYGELLPKTVRVKTMELNAAKSKALDAAMEIGLAQMMRSESFHQFAEHLAGKPLNRRRRSRQVILYESGDYSGPHNDHHPKSKTEKNGFVDVHIMFSNDAVQSQLLVYEERGYLSRAHDVAATSAIAIYRLPFWHYTTPLVARAGRESEARRWLLLGSFEFDPPLPELLY